MKKTAFLLLLLLLEIGLAGMPHETYAQFPPVIDLANTDADVTILCAAAFDKTGQCLVKVIPLRGDKWYNLSTPAGVAT